MLKAMTNWDSQLHKWKIDKKVEIALPQIRKLRARCKDDTKSECLQRKLT